MSVRGKPFCLLSAAIAAGCGVIAMYLAWYLDIEPSAAIVLTMTCVFLLALLFAPQQGYLSKMINRQNVKTPENL